MIYIIEFILFLIYTVLIFFVENFYILGILLIINIILLIKSNLRDTLNALKQLFFLLIKLMPFILFTSIINAIINNISSGILIGIRIILVCQSTYIFTSKMTIQKLQYVIENILKPLKIIKINSKEIAIIVCIGIAFIPIMQKELQELKNSLKAKGFKPNFKNFISKPNYILLPFITKVIKKVGEIEISLMSKGYTN